MRHPRRRIVVCLTKALQHTTMRPPIGKRYTLWARPAAWRVMGSNERSPEAGYAMTHAQFWKRLERLEQPLHSPTIVAVSLCRQDEPEPPHDPGIKVMQLFPGADLRRKKDHGRA